jgi:uncharacterized protein YecT (DUF1311 family)
MDTDPWRVDVTDADIRAAKRAWLAARDGDATDAQVDDRYDVLRRLVSAQAQQLADDVRARAAAATRGHEGD